MFFCYFFQTTHEFKQLVSLLIYTIKTQSPDLAFHAAVSLGRLCVVEPVSKTYLINRLPGLSPRDKGEVSSSLCAICYALPTACPLPPVPKEYPWSL